MFIKKSIEKNVDEIKIDGCTKSTFIVHCTWEQKVSVEHEIEETLASKAAE